MPQVIVTISPSGETTVEAQGVSGPGCRDLTRAIEDAIGRQTSDVKKPEFMQSITQAQQQQAQQ